MDQNLLFTSELFSKGYGFIPKLVTKDSDLSIEAKAIYSYLASYSGSGLSSFPSTSLILHDLGISEKRYLKHRKLLVDKGYITIRRERLENGFSKNIYIINQNPNEVVYSQNVGVRNVGIQNVGVRNVGTISNSFKSNNIISNSSNKKILSSSDEQDDVVSENSKKISLKNRFDEIWKEYPKGRKQGRDKAFNSYKRAVKDGVTDENILNGINDYKKQIEFQKTDIQYIKQGSTWFNGKCWDDEYITTSDTNNQAQEEKNYGWE